MLAPLLTATTASATATAQSVTLVADLPRLDFPKGLAVDAQGTIFAATAPSLNEISPSGEVKDMPVGQIDGSARHILVNDAGAVLVTDRGLLTHRVLRITPDDVVTVLIDESGDGVIALIFPTEVDLDAAGNLYVLAASRHVFKRTPGGVTSAIFSQNGFGTGEPLAFPPPA